MSAAAIAESLGIGTQERLDMFAVYLSLPRLHQIAYEDCLADAAIRICLKNTAHARRVALERRKTKSANDASQFELTP